MASRPQPIEAPRLKIDVAQELESDAASAVGRWLKTHAPPDVVECFLGMRALTTFIVEAHENDGLVPACSNDSILRSVGSVVNTLSALRPDSAR